MNIVVTGGCGFIGSHQVVALIEADHQVTVVDNLTNSNAKVLDRIEAITGIRPHFAPLDVGATDALARTLTCTGAEAIIHFAGYKSVPESTVRPVDYFDNNIGGLLSLLKAAERAGVFNLVFSSSGSVYGHTDQLPITEDHPHRPSNPYSSTKSICERILADLCQVDHRWAVMALRYFNPAGAHPSGLLGEDPVGPPSNLLPALTRAARQAQPVARVTGADFNTSDGSGIRDYIHVLDVAATHLRALHLLSQQRGFTALNVGRGQGVSVFEMITAVEQASGRRFQVEIAPRRPGDVAALYGDTTLAQELLGPIDYHSLADICEDAWRWEEKAAAEEPGR